MPDDDLTPTDEQVRRLLADARHTEPLPPDVAARLDEVLTGLQEGHGDETGAGPARTWPSPADLAAARRRRRVRTWLVAAAAVVVAGVGIDQFDWSGLNGSGDDASGGSSTSASDAEAAAPPLAASPSSSRDTYDWMRARAELSRDRFGDQVAALQDAVPGITLSSGQAPADSPADGLNNGATAYSGICSLGKLGPGRQVPVKYDDERAWLVFRVPEGDSQVVDLYLCGSVKPTRSITLPAR